MSFKFLSFPNTEILKYKTKKLLKKEKAERGLEGKRRAIRRALAC